MSLIHKFTLFVSVVTVLATGRAAELCMQNPGSTEYRSDSPAADCALPEPLKTRLSKTGFANALSEPSTTQSTRQSPASTATASWELRAEDGTVYAALKRWSVLAQWQISWEIPVDFPIEIEDAATGTYEYAVQRVLAALRVSDYPPHPCFHENRVVRIVRRIQGNDDECK